MPSYMNYSEAHYEAAAKIFAEGNISRAASLYVTQSTLPGEHRIPDEVELLYPAIIEAIKVD